MANPIQTPFTASLPSGQANGTLPPRSTGAGMLPPRLAAHPLQVTLRTQVMAAGEHLIESFVESLDSGVQGLLAESRHAAETRALLDLASSLSINRAALERGFLAALHRRFDPLGDAPRAGLFDRQSLQLLPADEMEESMVLTHLAECADAKAGEAGRQVCARLQWLAREQGLPALQQALSVSALPQCYAQAFRHAGLAVPERLLAYRLVETQGLKDWPALMQSVLDALDQQGLSMPRLLSAAAAQESLPEISDATVQTLRSMTTEGPLAQTLLRVLEPPMGRSDAGRITVLAGAWLDGLLRDTELPPALAPALESLRLVLIKAALCDPTFLTQAQHPVRQSVDQLVQRAAFTSLQGFSLASLRIELKELAERISIHGQFAFDALAMLPPLDADLVSQFHHQVDKERQARRESLLHRVHALASREIDARTLDVSLPSAARAALTRGFLPLLTTLMLRHGSTASQTRQARQLLERFVDSFALSIGADERVAVLAALQAQLLHAGLAGSPIAGVCQQLEQAYTELEQEAKATASFCEAPAEAALPAPPTPPCRAPRPSAATTPLQAILQPGQWFRVRDYKRGDDRWLSLSGVHLDQDRLSFSGFDGVTALALRASQFTEDLVSGLAEPLNPTASVLQALQRLRARPSATPERLPGRG